MLDTLSHLLEPLDYPRQALANLGRGLYRTVTGDANANDLVGMIPGALGVGAGLATGGVGGLLAGSLMGGVAQGAGKLSGSEAFDAPTPSALVEALGGDPESFVQNLAAGVATDPLTYAGLAGGARLARPGVARQAGRVAVGEAEPAAAAAQKSLSLGEVAPLLPEAEAGGYLPGVRESALADLPELTKALDTTPTAPAFYSRLERAAEGLPPKTDAQSALNYLKGKGVKQQEIDYTGLPAFLAQRGKGIPREDILGHIKGNAIELQPHVLGSMTAEEERLVDEFRRLENINRPLTEAERLVHRQGGDLWEAANTRHEQYTLPGGKQYRERVLTLPQNRMADEVYTTAEHEFDHWPGVENPLLHSRYSTRELPTGEKLLHLEELQSDWHQTGQKKGYVADRAAQAEARLEQIRAMKARQEQLDLQGAWGQPNWEAVRQEYIDLGVKRQALEKELALIEKTPPLSPFKDTWQELGLRDMLRQAAEGGHTHLAWTPGEAQLERYPGLGRGAEGMQRFYDQTIPNFLNKTGKPYGAQVGSVHVPELNQALPALPITPGLREMLLHKGQPLLNLAPLLAALGLGGAGADAMLES